MNPSLQGARAQLVNQLVYFDEERIQFLDRYYPEHNAKRSRVERVLDVYESELEQVLANFSEERLDSAALIGSAVELCYVEDSWVETFTLVFPGGADPDRNHVSFLSPLGFQLLMARNGETYRLALPSGEVSVAVQRIKYANCGTVV